MNRTAKSRPVKLRFLRRPLLESLEDRLAPSGIPSPAHVVIVMEENHGYRDIIGSSQAPYINSLAQQGASMTNSFAIEHPSQPNYLDLFSGSNQGVSDDNVPPAGSPYSTANLGSELINAGLSFGGFSEDMPSVGYTGGSSGNYVRKHNPWVDFSNVPSADNMPYAGYFPSDFTQLPTVSIVVPNLQNDMHDGSVSQGDQWLQNNIGPYVQWAATHNSLLIVTWDEDNGSEGNQIPTLFVGPMVKQGQYGENINHFSVLRTFEDMYGLPYAGQSASATPITDIWTTANPPAAPSNLTANAVSASEIDLSWTNNDTSTTTFKIERSTDGSNFTQITTVNGNVTTYHDTGLSANTQYSYRVRASNAGGDSDHSNVAMATTTTQAPPAAPSNLTANAASASEIDLSWTNNDTSTTTFKIERSTDGSNFTQITTVNGNVTSYNDTGLSANTQYYYRVRASNAGGDSGYSNVATATTTTQAPPAAPSNLTANAVSASEIDLSWTNNDTSTTTFKIERAPDADGDPGFSQIATVNGNVTTYHDTGLSANIQYSYRVRASNAGGDSDHSNVATATTTTQAPPAAPSNLTANAVSASEIDLSWTNNDSSTTTFKIERAPDADGDPGFSQIATVNGNVTTYHDTGLSANTQYSYRVRASNAGGDSDYSNLATATTDTQASSAAPSNLTANAVSASEIDLSWTNNASSSTTFKLYRSADGVNFDWFATTGQGTTSYAWVGASPATTWYFYVTASTASGDSAASNTASATPLAVPAAPGNLTATQVSSTRLIWRGKIIPVRVRPIRWPPASSSFGRATTSTSRPSPRSTRV